MLKTSNLMKMKTYEVTLSSDSGPVTIRTSAATSHQAIGSVCAAEKAPRSAVTTWRVIPTARQIAKTKNLMRGL